MFYETKEELVAALRSIPKLQVKVKAYSEQIDKYNYFLYEKTHSPLDYDIIGYKGNEPVRELKGHSYVRQDTILEMRDSMLNELEELEKKKKSCENKIKLANDCLNSMEEPLKSLCYKKYVEGKTYKQLVKEYRKEFIYDMELVRYMSRGINELVKNDVKKA